MNALDRVAHLANERIAADTKLRAAIRAAHAEGASVRKIAEAAGVSHGTIHNIVRTAD